MNEREADQILVERTQQDDKRVFELLVIKYHRKIARLVSHLIRNPTEVKDAVQDAFIRTYHALPQFWGESAFYTRLYRIAVNTAKNYLATQGWHLESSSGIDTEEAETSADGELLRDIGTPDSMLYARQVAETVNRAVGTLPGELRTTIALREIEGLSYEEIVKAMEYPIGTVRSRIFRAYKAIAEKLRSLLGTVEGKQ